MGGDYLGDDCSALDGSYAGSVWCISFCSACVVVWSRCCLDGLFVYLTAFVCRRMLLPAVAAFGVCSFHCAVLDDMTVLPASHALGVFDTFVCFVAKTQAFEALSYLGLGVAGLAAMMGVANVDSILDSFVCVGLGLGNDTYQLSCFVEFLAVDSQYLQWFNAVALFEFLQDLRVPHVDMYVPNHETVVVLLGPWFGHVTGEFVVGKLT